MAKAVEFREFTPPDSRGDLMRRLEQAPREHADALLATYDLLQKLHDKGVIDVFSGLLSTGDTIVDRLSSLLASKEGVAALRTILMLGSLMTSVDPDKLSSVISGSERKEPPSLLSIAKAATSPDARRGLATVIGFLQVLGVALEAHQSKG